MDPKHMASSKLRHMVSQIKMFLGYQWAEIWNHECASKLRTYDCCSSCSSSSIYCLWDFSTSCIIMSFSHLRSGSNIYLPNLRALITVPGKLGSFLYVTSLAYIVFLSYVQAPCSWVQPIAYWKYSEKNYAYSHSCPCSLHSTLTTCSSLLGPQSPPELSIIAWAFHLKMSRSFVHFCHTGPEF
jgi:hypothetical protein